MSYTKQEFKSGEKLYAAQLNAMDEQIAANEKNVGEISKELAKKYGVRWSTTDPNDLGERCFAAGGMTAEIGVGATDGHSDFDAVYPWSEMRRCNLKTNTNGATIVTFEGEDGFIANGRANPVENIPLDVKTDGYYDKKGALQTTSGRQCAIVNVTEGEEYIFNTQLGSALIPGVVFYDENDNFVKYEGEGTGTVTEVTLNIYIPEGVAKIIVQSTSPTTIYTMELLKVTSCVDTFVRIPKFYVDKYVEDGYEYRVVSATGATPHPAFIENGIELDEIFVAAYEGFVADGKMRSVGGVIPTSNETLATFLENATANGENYSLFDMRCVDAIWTLMAVEFGCRNTNHYLGYGYADFLQPIATYASVLTETQTNRFVINKAGIKSYVPVGSNITICKSEQTNILTQAKLLSLTDIDDGEHMEFVFDGSPIDVDTTCFIGSAAATTNLCETAPNPLAWHTGIGEFIAGSTTRNPIRYRWLENIYGNLWHTLPDITFDKQQMYVCKNMSDYISHGTSGGYKPVGERFPLQTSNGSKLDETGVNYWVSSLFSDIFAKGVALGAGYNISLTSKQGFGAYYYMFDGSTHIEHGGGYDHLYRCNMLTNRAWSEAERRWYLYGARLMFKNI